MENLENAKIRLSELEEKIAEYNNLIIENNPIALTKEFEEEYEKLQDEYVEVKSFVEKNIKKEKPEGFFNRVSVSLFFFFTVMFILAFPLIVNLIAQEVVLAFLTIEGLSDMTTLQIQTVVVLAYLIYPVALLLIHFLVRIIFVRSKENKKLYFVWSLIFGALLLLSTILGFIDLVMPVFD